jgi:hypothetical protein
MAASAPVGASVNSGFGMAAAELTPFPERARPRDLTEEVVFMMTIAQWKTVREVSHFDRPNADCNETPSAFEMRTNPDARVEIAVNPSRRILRGASGDRATKGRFSVQILTRMPSSTTRFSGSLK